MACKCRECLGPVPTNKRAGSVFCCSRCQSAFNNRRSLRGAQLFDVFMILRYERGLGRARNLWKIMCRMAQTWRDEDKVAGRQSWRPYSEIHDGLLTLRVDVLTQGEIGRARVGSENSLAAKSWGPR